jgi:hypothetical protein
MRRAISVQHTPSEALNVPNSTRVECSMKYLARILSLFLSIGLLVGCASDFQSAGSTSSATDDSADRSFHDTMDRLNEQMAVDAANAAAQQQFLDGMAAAQETENQHNAEFNQNGLH